MGVYNLDSNCVRFLVGQNCESLTQLVLDGENLEKEELIEIVESLRPKSLTKFRIYFGETISD